MAKILIVEDEDNLAYLQIRHLKRWGHEILGVAKNSCEVMTFLASVLPDIIFMDIAFEDYQGGLELCRKVKKYSSDIKVVFVSSYPVHFFRKELSSLSYDGCIDKFNFSGESEALLKILLP